MLSFANPFFLWGLAGLAVPVLLHLINRDLFRPLHFPSTRFILRGKLPVQRKRRIRDWLLLAIRMLLFTAIIGALARPEWQRTDAATGSSDSELVLLLDTSASISGWNSWKNIIAETEKTLSRHPSAKVGLVISSSGPAIIEPLTSDRNLIRKIISQTSPQPVAGNHRESLRSAARLFSKNSPATLAIFSDFQISDWSPTSLPELSSEIETIWINIADPGRENTGILHARALPLPDGGRQIIAEIRNFSQKPAEQTLSLTAGGSTFDRKISLSPGETRSIPFLLTETETSQAKLSLKPDLLPIDDDYFLWLERPPPIPVLIVAPLSKEPEKQEELFFLTRALSTETESEWLRFSIKTTEPAGLSASLLRESETIFLLGAAPYLTDSHWSLLRDHLANGGRLIFTPGNAPARQTSLLAQQNLIDLKFSGIAGADSRNPRPHHIDWIEPDSQLHRLFQDEAARTLSQVSIYRYTRLETTDKNSTTLLRTGNGDPLLIEQKSGSGTILISAFPFLTSWTDLPLSSPFLPIIRELVAGDLPPDHGIAHFDTGTDPAEIAAALNLPPEDPSLANIDPSKTGIQMAGNIPLIFNHPRSESTLETAGIADLQTAVTPRPQTTESSPATSANQAASPPLPLWPGLAVTAFLLFLIEMPIAALLRRSRKSESRSPVSSTGTVSESS